jgi:hypothetical protein
LAHDDTMIPYQAWLDALPKNLADSAAADALRAICDLDLLEGIEPAGEVSQRHKM